MQRESISYRETIERKVMTQEEFEKEYMPDWDAMWKDEEVMKESV